MKKLSLDALKAKAENVVSTDVMDKITGGNNDECHCYVTICFDDGTTITIDCP